MKKLRLVFLQKLQLQQGFSMIVALFDTTPMWGSQNDKFQEKHFEVKLCFLTPENLG